MSQSIDAIEQDNSNWCHEKIRKVVMSLARQLDCISDFLSNNDHPSDIELELTSSLKDNLWDSVLNATKILSAYSECKWEIGDADFVFENGTEGYIQLEKKYSCDPLFVCFVSIKEQRDAFVKEIIDTLEELRPTYRTMLTLHFEKNKKLMNKYFENMYDELEKITMGTREITWIEYCRKYRKELIETYFPE